MLNKKKLFTISFAIIVAVRAITWHTIASLIPYTELYIVFIGFWSLMILREFNPKIVSWGSNGLKVMLMLTGYFIVWGITATPAAFNDASEVMFRSLLMMSFIAVSSFWIRQLNCIDEIIVAIFIALSILIWILFFCYFKEINLRETLRTFWIHEEWLRTRVKFGFRNNIAAEYSMSVILLSLYILKREQSKKKKLFIWINNLMMLIIILSSNSRGTTVALIFMIIVYFGMSRIKKSHVKIIVKSAMALIFIITAVIVVAIVGGQLDITELLTVSNRILFLDNIEILKVSGRWLMGIGNISGTYYAERNTLYGLKSNYMEVSYIGFFVGSGVIGCIWLISILLLLINGILQGIKNSNEILGRWMLLVIIYMLFLSLFEGYIFSYTYVTSTVFLLLIISYINISFLNIKRSNFYAERENKAKYVSLSSIQNN